METTETEAIIVTMPLDGTIGFIPMNSYCHLNVKLDINKSWKLFVYRFNPYDNTETISIISKYFSPEVMDILLTNE